MVKILYFVTQVMLRIMSRESSGHNQSSSAICLKQREKASLGVLKSRHFIG